MIQVQPDRPELSRWTLSYHAFGQDWSFSWLARTLEVRRTERERERGRNRGE